MTNILKRRVFLQAAVAGLAGLLLRRKTAQARDAVFLPYGELTKKADLIVIASAQSSRDVTEIFNFLNVEVIGVETVFHTAALLKDTRPAAQKAESEQKPEKTFVLYHYRLANPETPIVDGPMLVYFDLKDKAQYLMFLRDAGEGRYEPLTTQYDADFSIEKLRFPA